MTTKFGTSDSDALVGQNSSNLIVGDAGDDTIVGGDSQDSLTGGSGDDTIIGGKRDDSLTGGSGDDLLNGGRDQDNLIGDSGDDTIIGGHHDDSLIGGSGNDLLDGGIGYDTLLGGDGADSFFFTDLSGLDIIADFDSSQGDKIIFDTASTGIAQVSDFTVHLGYSNATDNLKVTSLYVDNERVIEFNRVVVLEIENFEFV